MGCFCTSIGRRTEFVTDANIDMAIRACREEKQDLVRNKAQMQMVKESLNDGYCDVSGQGGDMSLAGTSLILYP